MAVALAPAHHHPLLFSPAAPQQVMQHQVQELAAPQGQEHQNQEVMQPPQAQQHCNNYAMKAEMPPWPAMTYDHPMLQPLRNAAAAQSQCSATSAPPPPHVPDASAHLSATALLLKAAQMGATIGGAGAHYTQMAGPATSAPGSATFGLGLPGLNAQQTGVMGGGRLAGTASHGRSGEGGGGGGGGGDAMTRDFLGLRALSHRDILGLAGFDSSCMGTAVAANANMSCYEPQKHTQAQEQSSNEPWHGVGSHS
jgi:hypothetical protein